MWKFPCAANGCVFFIYTAKYYFMKMTDFYEKYWTVDGLPVPPLPEKEKIVWDAAEELGVDPYVKIWKRRLGWQYLVNPLVQEHIDICSEMKEKK